MIAWLARRVRHPVSTTGTDAIAPGASGQRARAPSKRGLTIGWKMLVEEVLKTGTEVICAVKSGPVINDATMADAVEVGMTRLVPVIETGSDDIGVDWDNVSEEFMQAVKRADIILGKGHGNFETCHGRPGNFYFLLKAKCAMVAREIGCQLGDLVFTAGKSR